MGETNPFEVASGTASGLKKPAKSAAVANLCEERSSVIHLIRSLFLNNKSSIFMCAKTKTSWVKSLMMSRNISLKGFLSVRSLNPFLHKLSSFLYHYPMKVHVRMQKPDVVRSDVLNFPSANSTQRSRCPDWSWCENRAGTDHERGGHALSHHLHALLRQPPCLTRAWLTHLYSQCASCEKRPFETMPWSDSRSISSVTAASVTVTPG